MAFIKTTVEEGIATLVLKRGKVNALNNEVISELKEMFGRYENDPGINAVILTGTGKFFSFGFDIPSFLSFSKDEFTTYLVNFTSFYTYLFSYPKPVVAALNGHTIAGGCMISLACDYRLMASGKGRISLNEIGFGSSVFAGSTEMLRFWVGNANASRILYSGELYPAEKAMAMGLIDEAVEGELLLSRARETASKMGEKSTQAFASIKSLLRRAVVNEMEKSEMGSIREFVDIWYSESTWKNLEKIKIY